MSIVLIVSFIVGAVYPSSFPPSGSFDIRDIMLGAKRGETFSRIVERNLFVLASVFGGVVTAGFTTVLQLAWNGFRIGLLVRHYDPWILVVLVIPHATLEFAALLLGATISLWSNLKNESNIDCVNSTTPMKTHAITMGFGALASKPPKMCSTVREEVTEVTPMLISMMRATTCLAPTIW
jgi:hypothetical protein